MRRGIAVIQCQQEGQQWPAVPGRDEALKNSLPVDALAAPAHERRGFQSTVPGDAPGITKVPDLAVPNQVYDLMLDRGNSRSTISDGDGPCPVQDIGRLRKTGLASRAK